jgi:hypothetical protein
MERGVYFDAWFPRQHCYHPSLPPRRLKMIDDLVDYRATALVWSALGGGSLSLPYLEQEAHGEVDPRFRFYGFVNDAEFIAACQARGIKVFGIVFEVQGWEFPARLNGAEDRVLALNEVDGEPNAWLGLRAFSGNRYPRLWPAFEHYFPDGLVNSRGERVTDLIEECVSRDIHGEALHARWVEVPGNPQQCYLMDRNNPVWREYLKAIIRIQIDAGVDGIQLDEAETPLTATQYGGCFCHDCMTGFAEYLGRPGFHYGKWLLEQGHDFKDRREETPLFWDYIRYQRGQITRYFGELADYTREYAAGRGREVLVSGNFFDLYDQYHALEPKVDVIITEMRNTTYRQPDWYRYVAGFAREKPVIVVENPYGGVVPELIEQLGEGRGHDRFRMSLYEAAALGANMSAPYGSWMGSVIEDSFYAPHDLVVEIQSFLADHERVFARATYSEVGVVYSVRSHSQAMASRDAFADNRTNVSADVEVPFLAACRALSRARQPYDVVYFPDGELRADELTAPDLAQYRTLVVAGCDDLSDHQAALLREFQGDIVEAPDLADPQVRVEGDIDLALCVHRLDGAAAVHLIRYDYDEAADAVPVLERLELAIRLPAAFARAEALSPGGGLRATVTVDGLTHRLVLEDVPLYGVVVLSP